MVFFICWAFRHFSTSDLSKPKKLAWLREINKQANEQLPVLGKLIKSYMELPGQEQESKSEWPTILLFLDPNLKFKDKLSRSLEQWNLQYIPGGFVSDGRASQSKSWKELIKGKNNSAVEAEFERALSSV